MIVFQAADKNKIIFTPNSFYLKTPICFKPNIHIHEVVVQNFILTKKKVKDYQ